MPVLLAESAMTMTLYCLASLKNVSGLLA